MATEIKTAGDLRGFLAEVLVGIKEGEIDVAKASAISKVAAQINQSLAVEVSTTLQLQKMGKDQPIAGSMLIRQDVSTTSAIPALAPAPPVIAAQPDEDGMVWCDQCDMRVTMEQAAGCRSKFCKVKAAA